MGRINITLSNNADRKLRKLAEDNCRTITKQMEWLIMTFES